MPAICRNIVIYSVVVPLAWKSDFLQHAQNCVNTSVLVRRWPKDIHCKYCGFGLLANSTLRRGGNNNNNNNKKEKEKMKEKEKKKKRKKSNIAGVRSPAI